MTLVVASFTPHNCQRIKSPSWPNKRGPRNSACHKRNAQNYRHAPPPPRAKTHTPYKSSKRDRTANHQARQASSFEPADDEIERLPSPPIEELEFYLSRLWDLFDLDDDDAIGHRAPPSSPTTSTDTDNTQKRHATPTTPAYTLPTLPSLEEFEDLIKSFPEAKEASDNAPAIEDL